MMKLKNLLIGEFGTVVFRTSSTIIGGILLWLATHYLNTASSMADTLVMLNQTMPMLQRDLNDLKNHVAVIEDQGQTRYIDLITRVTRIEARTPGVGHD